MNTVNTVTPSQVMRARWPDAPGIYCILNRKGVHVYVGKTASLSRRLATHISQLRRSKHTVHRLQADYIADPGAIEFHIIEEVDDADGLRLSFLEQWWLNKLSETHKPYNHRTTVLVPSKETRHIVCDRLAQLLHDTES